MVYCNFTGYGDSLKKENGTLKIEETRCFSVAEAAQLLGICKAKVYELIRENSLPHLRVGRRIVVPAEALCMWMQAKTEGMVTACHR